MTTGRGWSRSVAQEAKDLLRLGPAFVLRRHLRRGSGGLPVRGFGTLTVRRGTSDLDALREVLRDREYELPASHDARVTERYRRILAAGRTPVIVDAGANIGAASVWFAVRYPEAVVMAVEPEASNAEICRANVGARGVRVVEAAIGARPGRATVHGEETAKWGATTERSDGGDVEIVTVDDVTASVPGGELFIVKIDIEGFEEDLFEENTAWCDRAEVVYIEPHDWEFPFRGTSDGFRRLTAAPTTDLLVVGESLAFVRRPVPHD